MAVWVKLLIIVAMVVGDAVAMALVAPRLVREGKTVVVAIMGASFLLTTFVVAYVLFGIVA